MADRSDPSAMSARRRRTRDLILAALDVLDRHPSLTRADLSRLTGLSPSAVSDAVGALLASGELAEHSAGRTAGRGRRPAVLSRPAVEGVVVGIDLGHAHVTAAVALTSGEVLVECSQVLDVDHRPEQALDLAAGLAREALRQAGHSTADVLGIAAGIPGPLDRRTQVVRAPSILADWVGRAPAVELSERLGQPVVVGNDADMGARGEQAYGAAHGLDDFLYIKASHGIGAGIVLSGVTYRGSTGIAGEIGHTQLPGATSWCRCGSQGCLETVVSIGAVRRQLAHVLSTAASAVDADSLPPLAELAHDPAAARVITDAGRTVGRVVAALVNCLNPAAVILGGELGAAGAPFAAGVRESVDRYAQPAGAQAVDVLSGLLGARAELLGTIAVAVAAHRGGATFPGPDA